ncbi:MAG TPA: tetratricopeptide repeat protein [Anaerolineae bacterium]|nr:tetratricopeptide repeat protein [Anaerolineae bacterium]HQI85520.1 tetratricopeptide repeat protein [Anaerolineae bacterium]
MSWLEQLFHKKSDQLVGSKFLRFDGLYISELHVQGSQPSHTYLKFYDDARVVSIEIAFTPRSIDQTVESFGKIPEHALSKGHYRIQERTLVFSLTHQAREANYRGTIFGDRLELHVYSQINAHKSDQIYWFVTSPLSTTRQESCSASELLKKAPDETAKTAVVYQEQRNKAARLLQQAWQFDQNNNPIEALLNFDEALALTPNDPEGFYGRGIVYCKTYNYSMAIADLNRALWLKPDFTAALAERGLAFVDIGNLAQGMTDYDKAIGIDPTYGIAHINKGSAYLLQEEWQDALSSLDKGISLEPGAPGAYFNRATAHEKLGNYDRAAADLKTILRFFPKSQEGEMAQSRLQKLEEQGYCRTTTPPPAPTILMKQGTVQPIQGDPARAIAAFDKAIQQDPGNAKAYYARGHAYVASDNLTAAIHDFDKALDLFTDPCEQSNVCSDRGIAYARQGNLRAARADFDKAIELNPANHNAYNNRAHVYTFQGDFVKAIADYNKAAEMNPGFPDTYNNRGSTYKLQGDLAAALADFDKAIELAPSYCDVYWNRSQVHSELGDNDKALTDPHRYLELCPDAQLRGAVEKRIAEIEKNLMSEGKN